MVEQKRRQFPHTVSVFEVHIKQVIFKKFILYKSPKGDGETKCLLDNNSQFVIHTRQWYPEKDVIASWYFIKCLCVKLYSNHQAWFKPKGYNLGNKKFTPCKLKILLFLKTYFVIKYHIQSPYLMYIWKT